MIAELLDAKEDQTDILNETAYYLGNGKNRYL